MPTYYRDDRVRITSSEVWVDGTGYAIDDLQYVWHARGRPDARALLRRTGRWLLIAAALALVAACAARTPALFLLGARVHSLAVRVALVIAGSLAFLAVAWPVAELVLSGMDHVHVHGVTVHEIWARRRGEEILLLRTSDALLFGRIYRALARAIESRP